ncbi:MAG: deoxyuridine 5'-triphosphate nucleotidohydrolase [Chloroflexi bacterium]|nr:deoxyuridine 5'-triphosphate nucleotidohydrolase [Chloroflexota bacterium]MYD47425.1 deoxyuridine 5'-triphosphate nucleotidohydrolase [Chloroflexota bacterium]
MSPFDITHPGALNRDAIAGLIDGDPALVAGYIDLGLQLQPNGFDLTLRSVANFHGETAPGSIGVADADRKLPNTVEELFDGDGWVLLTPGPYLITFNEIVNIPRHLMALARPRSSLLRAGVAIHTAVWDGGYSGRSQALLTVHHPAGFRLERNARVAQLVFFPLAAPDPEGYTGRYRNENL